MAQLLAKKRATRTPGRDPQLYTLDVFIIDGPMTKSFLKKTRVISRTIQIRGDQTLAELHRTIFDAFDREDEHMYEFQIGYAEYTGSFVRALDEGGMIWEGVSRYESLDYALRALDQGIAEWVEEHG